MGHMQTKLREQDEETGVELLGRRHGMCIYVPGKILTKKVYLPVNF